MRWFIKASVQKDNSAKFEPKFKVGAFLKHKATGLSATILNYYANHYIVEMERKASNLFKKQIIALTEERIEKDFTPSSKTKEENK